MSKSKQCSAVALVAAMFALSPTFAAAPRPAVEVGVPSTAHVVSFDEAVSIWITGALSAKRLEGGGVRLVDCYDAGVWAARLGPQGANLAYGFTGPGYKLSHAMGLAGVQRRFVAIVQTGAFGEQEDLSAAYRAWVANEGASVLREQASVLAEAIDRAGYELGADLTYTPGTNLDTPGCTKGRCDCKPCDGGTCGCETVIAGGANADCKPPRENCNTTTYGSAPALRW